MDKVVIFLLFSGLLLTVSCSSPSGKVSRNGKNKTDKEIIAIKDCDEFLKQYEDSIDVYLKVVDEYFNNPMDESLATRYLKVLKEATILSSKWESLVECADDKAYKDRFEEISKNMEEKLNELGL